MTHTQNRIRSIIGRVLITLLFLLPITYFNYFLERDQFVLMVILFAISLIAYFLLIFSRINKMNDHFTWMIITAILIRVILLFALPNLSDDYFRFLWDGHLLNMGISPYAHLPRELIATGIITDDYALHLYEKMNSPVYYSVYPAINQYFFSFANTLFPANIYGGVIILKLFMLMFELISITCLYLLSKKLMLGYNTVLLYALNPLVIIEFSGNLHFEGIMIAFLLQTLLLLSNRQWLLAAIPYTGAILTKLHPLMILPFIIKYLGWKKGIQFSFIAGALTLILFSPAFLPIQQAPELASNFFTSIRLYFETFEFNASIYYILRWIGTMWVGYNPIHVVGKILFGINLMALSWIFYKQKDTLADLIKATALAYFIYVLLSTTVHPWYILSVLPFALLVRFRTPLVWTCIIILSYFAYSSPDWHENFYLLFIEYTFVFIYLFYELSKPKILNESKV